MNQLKERGKPGYGVVPAFLVPKFEAQIVQSYCNRMEDKHLLEMHLPEIGNDLVLNDAVHPEVWAAAYLGLKNNNSDYWLEVTKDKTFKEVSDIALDIFTRLELKPWHEFDDDMYSDVKKFLDFNYISYVDIYSPSLWRSGYFYTNMPLKQVW